MAVSREQFARQLAESGLIATDDLRSFLAGLPADERPHDGEQFARLLVRHGKLTAYQAQQIYAGKGKSLVLGNYVILDKLGQGGMGMVLKAEHKRMERVVALKVLSPAVVGSPEALKRFQREVKAAAKLTHPNIVIAHDADEAGGTHFLVMEYVEGSDLSSLVKKQGPLALDKALACVIQAAKGLQYAHQRGVVHRDIKPGNLLLDMDGTVKILDMGLARLEQASGGRQPTDSDELTGSGQIMGTVDYMAPEQALNTKHADARADIYSLGITLWYLITGRAMYAGETAMEKLMAHQTKAIPSLADVGRASRRPAPHQPAASARESGARGQWPGASSQEESALLSRVDPVFQRMVAKKPEERYQTMAEVAAALESCQRAAPATAPAPLPAPTEEDRFSQFLRNMASVGQASRLPISSGQEPGASGQEQGGAAAASPLSPGGRGAGGEGAREREGAAAATAQKSLATQTADAAGFDATVALDAPQTDTDPSADKNELAAAVVRGSPDLAPPGTAGLPIVAAPRGAGRPLVGPAAGSGDHCF